MTEQHRSVHRRPWYLVSVQAVSCAGFWEQHPDTACGTASAVGTGNSLAEAWGTGHSVNAACIGRIDMRSAHSARSRRWKTDRAARTLAGAAALGVMLAAPREAHASLFPPAVEDKLATFLAIVVLFVVPIVLIVLFWMVHILPEKIAHKRHHPQFEAIRTLCLLSLVFGGLLWPLAWLWAYSKPVVYKMAYGTDTLRHDGEEGPHAVAEPDNGMAALRDRLARLEARGVPASELTVLLADIEALEAKFADGEAR